MLSMMIVFKSRLCPSVKQVREAAAGVLLLHASEQTIMILTYNARTLEAGPGPDSGGDSPPGRPGPRESDWHGPLAGPLPAR
jgi:hypothetical protein